MAHIFYTGIFQSTRPVRGATTGADFFGTLREISIHAPREGRDLNVLDALRGLLIFQSTRPVRGATY